MYFFLLFTVNIVETPACRNSQSFWGICSWSFLVCSLKFLKVLNCQKFIIILLRKLRYCCSDSHYDVCRLSGS